MTGPEYLTVRLNNRTVKYMDATAQLNATFAALADPTRRSILDRLRHGQKTVTELAEPFQISMPAITKHLKVLERAGLIERGRDGQRRPCRLVASPLTEAADWIDEYRVYWEQAFDRLEQHLAAPTEEHE